MVQLDPDRHPKWPSHSHLTVVSDWLVSPGQFTDTSHAWFAGMWQLDPPIFSVQDRAAMRRGRETVGFRR
jgi:hypothetical protein